MANTSTTSVPIAPEFDALIEHLPFWATEQYHEVEVIKKIRKVLMVYDTIQSTSGANIGA